MPEGQDSLALLIRHELAIKQLYERFIEMFPEHKDFWGDMAKEEQKHAECLQGLSSNAPVQMWFRNESRFKQLAINRSMEYVEQQIERARKRKISMLEALSIAHDLEEALIEKQFISLHISGPEEIKNAMKCLVADTQRHRRMILEKLDFHKRGTH